MTQVEACGAELHAGLGGWGHDIGLHGAALNLLAAEEAIEHDTRRNVYRLTTKRPEHQLNIYEEN